MAPPAEEAHELTNLEQLLDRLNDASQEHGKISVGAIVEAVGRRSFGPLLLVSGLMVFSPLSGVPGVPTLVGVLVALIAVQLLLGRNDFWLPQWLMRRHVSHDKFCKAVHFLRAPARFIDRFLRPRLQFLTRSAGVYTVALICAVIALAMPPLELVPFSSSVAGAALAAFGLSLIAHDGVVGLIALSLTAGIVVAVGYSLL